MSSSYRLARNAHHRLPSLLLNSAHIYTLRSPWKEDAKQGSLRVVAGQPHTFSLQPFEVLVLEGAALK
jgi:hypothetical protein